MPVWKKAFSICFFAVLGSSLLMRCYFGYTDIVIPEKGESRRRADETLLVFIANALNAS